jgi:hypothetical protein
MHHVSVKVHNRGLLRRTEVEVKKEVQATSRYQEGRDKSPYLRWKLEDPRQIEQDFSDVQETTVDEKRSAERRGCEGPIWH